MVNVYPKPDGVALFIADQPDANSITNTDTFRCASMLIPCLHANSVVCPGIFCAYMQLSLCVQANSVKEEDDSVT